MTPPLWAANLLAWSLQVAVLTGTAAVVVHALRLGHPRWRLGIWQAVLAACLLMAPLQPWRVTEAPSAPAPAAESAASSAATALTRPAPPLSEDPWPWLAALLAAGAAARLAWLGVGLARLSRYRRVSRFLDSRGTRRRHGRASYGRPQGLPGGPPPCRRRRP